MSNVTLSKFWEGTPNSLTLNYSRDQNLTTGEILQTIPLVSLTAQTFPFRGENSSFLDPMWYEDISYAYNSQFKYIDEKRLVNSSMIDGVFLTGIQGAV